MSMEKTISLARLAVGMSNGLMDANTVTTAKEFVSDALQRGETEENALSEVAAIPVGYITQHLWDDDARANFRATYEALELDKTYCPTDVMLDYLEFLHFRVNESEDKTIDSLRKVYEELPSVQSEKQRAAMLYSILSFMVYSGAYVRYPDLLADALKAFEAISVEKRQASLETRTAVIQGLMRA